MLLFRKDERGFLSVFGQLTHPSRKHSLILRVNYHSCIQALLFDSSGKCSKVRTNLVELHLKVARFPLLVSHFALNKTSVTNICNYVLQVIKYCTSSCLFLSTDPGAHFLDEAAIRLQFGQFGLQFSYTYLTLKTRIEQQGLLLLQALHMFLRCSQARD